MAIRAKKHLRIPTVVRSMHAGVVPCGPVLAMLLAERPRMAAMMNAASADIHVQDPLAVPAGHVADGIKPHISKGSGWKFAYAQRFGEAVTDAAAAGRKQCLSRIRGSLLHCAEKIDRPLRESPNRLYRFVPEDIQGAVTDADFAAVAALATGGWQAACRAVAAGKAPAGISPIQARIVAECRAFALSRHRAPVFNRVGPKGTDDFVVQVRPDDRTYIGFANHGERLFGLMNSAMRVAWAAGARSFPTSVVLTDFHGKGSFAVPILIGKEVWDKARRGREAEVSGFMLEIGPGCVEVRVTIRRPRTTPDLKAYGRMHRAKLDEGDFEALAAAVNARGNILSRDIGLARTMAHSLVRRETPVTAETLRLATFATKDSSRTYLETHVHPGDNVASSWSHCGRNFLSRVADLARIIDRLRARIDTGYARLGAIRAALAGPLGLATPEARIDRDATHPDPFVRGLIARFFHLFDRIRQTKALRIGQYRKIAAIKKCWFGWVTNREAEIALLHDAAVVREDTGFGAMEKADPEYRGRAFNRLMNNGCRGQIERMASSKLAWLGIPRGEGGQLLDVVHRHAARGGGQGAAQGRGVHRVQGRAKVAGRRACVGDDRELVAAQARRRACEKTFRASGTPGSSVYRGRPRSRMVTRAKPKDAGRKLGLSRPSDSRLGRVADQTSYQSCLARETRLWI